MISCSEAVRHLWEYLDGTLQGPDVELVEDHLARCRRCCGELEFAHELRGLLASGRDLPLPDDALTRLQGALDDLENNRVSGHRSTTEET